MAAWQPNDKLPTREEMEAVERLRASFKNELDSRRRQNTLHECLFSDMALTRVLRGNDDDEAMARKWLKRCIEQVRDHEVDDMIKDMSSKLDHAGVMTPLDHMLPGYDDVKEYVRALFTAPELSPTGDLINYISFSNFDMWAMMRDLDWQKWVRYMKGATILRMVECARQSEKQGRMVRVVTIIDVGGLSFSKVNCPTFHWKHNRDLASFQESVAAEIFGPVYILNAPSMVQSVIKACAKMLPQRFAKKINLVEGEGLEDPEFIKLVGGEGQLKHMLALREAMFNGGVIKNKPKDRDITIGRREVFAHSIDVKAGERLTFEFRVKPGRDAQFGESNIHFCLLAFWTNDKDPANYHRQVCNQLLSKPPQRSVLEQLQTPRWIKVSDGKYQGGVTAARPGVIWLQWSNVHSIIRGKTVWFKVTTEVAEEAEKPAQSALQNGERSKSMLPPRSVSSPPAAAPATRQPSAVSNGASSQVAQPPQGNAPGEATSSSSWACCMVRA